MKIINGLHRTLCPTFPRSGNTFLILVLRDYFGVDRFRFADIHIHPERGFEKDPLCVLQKTHDFDLNDKPQKHWKHLVQIRHPLDAIASYYELKKREGKTPVAIRQWWSKQLDYYAGFAKKWVAADVPNRLVVNYETLMRDPIETLTDVVLWIEHKPDGVDVRKLSKVAMARLKPSRIREYHRPYEQL